MKDQNTLLIVDGNALIHRAFHAIPPLQTKDGRLVNAVYGFLSILAKAMHDLRPSCVAVTFDRKGPTFRHKAYAEYKATREQKAPELYAQIPMAEEILAVLRIPVFAIEGFEADDVIATICEKTKKEKGLMRVILTGDQDTLQLVEENTNVVTPGKGIKETIRYDDAKVFERFGLKPSQLVDYKALRGDTSDNIPGVHGIGEKGASTLIAEFGNIENLYKAIEKNSPEAEKIKPKQLTALVAGKADAFKAKELVTLVRNAPVEFSFKDCGLHEPDREKLVEILSGYEMKTMLPRLLEVMPGGARAEEDRAQAKKGKKEIASPVRVIKTDAEMAELLTQLKGRESFALRTFHDGHFLDGKLNAIAIAWDAAQVVLPFEKKWIEKLSPVFSDEAVHKIGHDVKRDIETLHVAGLPLVGVEFDTMLASYILSPGTRAHEIETLAFAELGRELPVAEKQLEMSIFRNVDISNEAERYAAEAGAIWDLAKKLRPKLESENLKDIFERFELPLAGVLARMETHGVDLDSKFLAKLSLKLSTRIAQLDKEIIALAGTELNVNSSQQLSKVLFETLKIQEKVKIRKTASGSRLSTGAGELEKLKDAHPIVPLILEYRELAKIFSTYVDALPKLVRLDTKRLHTTFNQAVAATGRLSSSDPNLQNIPIRSELGREIRKAFIAAPGHELIVFDYSQFELRILASLSGDPAMIDAFRQGQDIHSRTASEIWGIPIKEVTKEQRYAAKTINFGIAYGMGANALAESAGIPREEARSFIEKYFLTFQKVTDFLQDTKDIAAAQGYVETLFGRRRYIPELQSNVPPIRAAGERMAINAPIQGTNADAIKLAMIELDRWIGERYGFAPEADVKMIIQVHDELVFEVKEGLGEKLVPTIKQKMEEVVNLKVPVVVEARIGKSWGELEKTDG